MPWADPFSTSPPSAKPPCAPAQRGLRACCYLVAVGLFGLSPATSRAADRLPPTLRAGLKFTAIEPEGSSAATKDQAVREGNPSPATRPSTGERPTVPAGDSENQENKDTQSDPVEFVEASARLERGIAAWRNGEFVVARAELTPMALDSNNSDPRTAELGRRALRYLADSVLHDQSLPPHRRQQLAEEYILLILESDPDWAPPPALHGDEFYKIVTLAQSKKELALARACEAERMACEADLSEARSDLATAQAKVAELQHELDERWVITVDRIARNRAVALIPAGIGHLYNGNRALAFSFMAAEAGLAAVGIGLLMNRLFVLNCVRTAGFSPGSLRCAPDPHILEGRTDNEVRALIGHRRAAEQGIGIALIATAVVDIILAQITFKPYVTRQQRRVRQRDLDAEQSNDRAPRSRRPQRPQPRRSRRKQALRSLRPNFSYSRQRPLLELRMDF